MFGFLFSKENKRLEVLRAAVLKNMELYQRSMTNKIDDLAKRIDEFASEVDNLAKQIDRLEQLVGGMQIERIRTSDVRGT